MKWYLSNNMFLIHDIDGPEQVTHIDKCSFGFQME